MDKKEKIKKYFNQKAKLNLKNKAYFRQVKRLIDFMLAGDLENKGDVTTNSLITKNVQTKAEILARENGLLAGLEEIKWLAQSHGLRVTSRKKDGSQIKKGEYLLTINGRIKDIFKTERTILNILQRMSGIATQTNKLVKKTKNKVLICPTRKTSWGLLDKKAVALGGGGTHRLGLYDWILIKDNHLKFILHSSFLIPRSFWEIEVKNKTEALKFSELHPGAMMLDNMKPKKIQNIIKILKKYKPNMIFEASGGINEKNICQYAQTGAEIISLGALTHSAKALDLNLQVHFEKKQRLLKNFLKKN